MSVSGLNLSGRIREARLSSADGQGVRAVPVAGVAPQRPGESIGSICRAPERTEDEPTVWIAWTIGAPEGQLSIAWVRELAAIDQEVGLLHLGQPRCECPQLV